MNPVALNSRQAALRDAVLSAPRPSTFEVRWPVGTGKSTTAAAILDAVLASRPTARSLLLCSTLAQREYFHELLRRPGRAIKAVDRHWLRAKQATRGLSEELWQSGAYVMDLRFAAEPDMVASLISAEWDVVILDGLDSSSDIHANRVIESLSRTSPELQVVVFSDSTDEPTSHLGPQPRFESKLQVRDLIAPNYRTAGAGLAPQFVVIQPDPSDTEQKLGDEVGRLVSNLRSENDAFRQEARALARKSQSSQAALDEALRRLWTRVEGSTGIEPLRKASLSTDIQACLQQLEGLRDDSKVAAISDLVQQLLSSAGRRISICIFTEFRATALYIQQVLSFEGRPGHLLHSGMTSDERSHQVHSFLTEGGILIATGPSIQGWDIPGADSVILFDLPANSKSVLLVLSRFLMLDRQTPLPVYVVPPDERYGPVEPMEYAVGDLADIVANWR